MLYIIFALLGNTATRLNTRTYEFQAEGRGAKIGTTTPVSVVLAIGNDFGAVTVNAVCE